MTTDEPTSDILKARTSIARSLRSIEELALDLHAQALNDSNAKDFPGGTALHMLGPGVARQQWDDRYAEVELQSYADDQPLTGWNDPLVYQGDTEEQPLNVLATWTRMVREDRDQPTSLAPTLSREIDYLRGQLDWICRVDAYGESEWPLCFEMQSELRTLVRRMEDVLHQGERVERTRVRCTRCDEHSRLEHQYQAGVRLDAFRCPHCREPYTWAEFMNAYHQNLAEEGAEKFILATEAQKAAGIPIQTMRSWMRRLTVRTACDMRTHNLIVWWPDVRDQVETRRIAALTKATKVGA